MAYLLFPFAVMMALLGVISTLRQEADQVPGAGENGIAQQRARVQVIQAQAFAQACLEAAIRAPSAIADNQLVTLPAGLSPIDGARCDTTASGSGRLVIASLPDAPGVAAGLMDALDGSMTWARVTGTGQATVLASGQQQNAPTDVPVGSLIYQVRVSP